MVQEGIAYSAYSSTAKEAHSMKLEIMIDYFLDSDNDEILVDNGLTLGHLSLDEIEGAYFQKILGAGNTENIKRLHHYCISW
jgi:hypothetical protein